MKAWEDFYKNVLRSGLIVRGDKILLAVSGGADSMCMLHLFCRLSKKINLELAVINFDHGLRRESKHESAVVAEFAEKIGVKFLTKKLDVKKYSKAQKISEETAGRILRYENFAALASGGGFNKVATAHNLNDNAETVLMWLLRGSGNFAGIPQRRKLTSKTDIVRPMLTVSRKSIEEYARAHKIPFVTDSSNFSNDYTRNKIRHKLIPEMLDINPKALEHIFSIGEIQAREDAYLEEISINSLKKCAKISKNRILLDLPTFLRYNEAVRYRILKNLIPDKKYNSRINHIYDKIAAGDESVFKISRDWSFCVKRGKAVFLKV